MVSLLGDEVGANHLINGQGSKRLAFGDGGDSLAVANLEAGLGVV